MARKKEYRDSPSYTFQVLGGQSEPGDKEPDQPWRYALVESMYREWRYVGEEKWRLEVDRFPPRRTVAEFTPRQLEKLVVDGIEQLSYAAVTFNENFKATQEGD